MAWQMVATLGGGFDWSYTPNVVGDWFRLTYAPSPNDRIKGLIAQVNLGTSPIEFFWVRRFYCKPEADVYFLPKPPVWTARALAIRQYYTARAVTIEVWDAPTGNPPIVLVP